jgi:hypothetical protein
LEIFWYFFTGNILVGLVWVGWGILIREKPGNCISILYKYDE